MADDEIVPIVRGPAVTGTVEPGQGRAVVTYFPNVADPAGDGSLEITLTGFPWGDTGQQPFTWRLLPPSGNRTFPVVWLAVAREVTVKTRVIEGFNRGRPPLNGFVLGPQSPLIEIVRPQDDDLIPQPSAKVIELWRVIPPPFMVGPVAEDPFLSSDFLAAANSVNVTTKPSGVDILNILAGYKVSIDVIDPKQPAAYVYEILNFSSKDEDNLFGDHIVVRVAHSHNVKVRAVGGEDLAGFLSVLAIRVPDSSFTDIPPQGTVLENTTFEPVEVEVKFRPKNQGLIFLFELGIQFVPYVGVLYDISQLVFALATGKDFWGREVTGPEILLYGITALVPFGFGAVRAELRATSNELRALRAELKNTSLARALDEGVLAQVGRAAEQDLLEAVGQLDVKSATDLGRLVTRFASGQLTAKQVLARFDDLIGNAYLRALDRRGIERLLTEGFTNLRNPKLAAGFNAFATKKAKAAARAAKAGKASKPGFRRTVSPAEWALQQKGKSRFISDLVSELGPNWRQVLSRSLRNDGRLKPISAADLAHYDKLVGRVEDYKTLAKLNKGKGDLYEVDHLLEQRFWRNDPRIATAFDEVGEGMATLVPLNPTVSARMEGKVISYVHTTKTAMLADLIPNGQEARYTVQQIMDAHLFVLDSLGVDKSITFGERLLDNFRLLARSRGERIVLRQPTGRLFTPFEKWPVLPGSL